MCSHWDPKSPPIPCHISSGSNPQANSKEIFVFFPQRLWWHINGKINHTAGAFYDATRSDKSTVGFSACWNFWITTYLKLEHAKWWMERDSLKTIRFWTEMVTPRATGRCIDLYVKGDLRKYMQWPVCLFKVTQQCRQFPLPPYKYLLQWNFFCWH